MTNVKKIGLTALAGSLVASTAMAGALDISGAAKVSYVSQDETENTGNPYSMTRDITFSGSGEMDNGMTISYFQMLSAGSFSSSGLTLGRKLKSLARISKTCLYFFIPSSSLASSCFLIAESAHN